MSGDAVECRIVREPIRAEEVLRRAASAADGAVLLFWGIVREENAGRAVTHLQYDAYAPMAAAELRRICTEARERWGTGRIVALHRAGRLEIGEASVAIAVASPHRAEAYEASRYVIEELKRRVPLWKREGYVEGPSEWLSGAAPAAGRPA